MTMKEDKTVYYLVWRRVVAKREKRNEHYEDYLFKSGEWVEDKKRIIADHLIGFDPSEPKDSPYRIGSTSVMSEMEEISQETAISLISAAASFLKNDPVSADENEKDDE